MKNSWKQSASLAELLSARGLGLFSVIVVAILSRFLPHPPNMTAMGALALFAGAHFQTRWLGLALPLAVLALTDFVLGFHNSMLFTYGAWLSLALVSSVLLKNFTWSKLGGMSVFAGLWFFLISNFGVWSTGQMYPMNAAGLLECFVAALPFLANQVLGDLIFSAALFSLWQVLDRKLISAKQSA